MYGISKIGTHQYSFKEKDEYEEYTILKEKFEYLGNTEDTWFSGDQSRMY
ncbi:MAG: hypothetical protein FWC53_03770 [Firmicutes bacterium]|nr:hypothetical protein [Bacillota bacterium]